VNRCDEPYYGKYRGIVVSAADVGMRGRITASVVLGGTPLQIVAEACTPYPGFYAIPPEGSGVWIEFEEGNVDKPIWSGCWWRDGEVAAMLSPDIPPPSPATAHKTVVLSVSAAGFPAAVPVARIKLNTVTGEVTTESLMAPATPALPTAIKLSATGIAVTYTAKNAMQMTPVGIDFNKTALTIT
jgi:hypothetical protein